MQFGINKHEQIIQRLQFVVFEKFASACLFQIAREKSFDYLLIIYKWQFLLRFSILLDKWRQPATSTLLDKNLTCEFKRKNWFTLSKSLLKTEQFLLTLKSSVYPQLNIEELDHKAKEKLTSLRIRCGFLLKCLSGGWESVSRVYAEKKPFNSAQEYWEYRETKLKSTWKRVFWALKDIS